MTRQFLSKLAAN